MTEPDPILGRIADEIATSGVYVMRYFTQNHDAIVQLLDQWPGTSAAFWDGMARGFAATVPPIVGRNGKPPTVAALSKAWVRHQAQRAKGTMTSTSPALRVSHDPRPVEDHPPSFVGIGKPKGNTQ